MSWGTLLSPAERRKAEKLLQLWESTCLRAPLLTDLPNARIGRLPPEAQPEAVIEMALWMANHRESQAWRPFDPKEGLDGMKARLARVYPTEIAERLAGDAKAMLDEAADLRALAEKIRGLSPA